MQCGCRHCTRPRASSSAHVFLVGVEEGLLPHKGSEDDDPALIGRRIEEERRLMYVGVTRAQRSLSITWCRKRRRVRDEQVCEPSRFIGELMLEQTPIDPGGRDDPLAATADGATQGVARQATRGEGVMSH